MEDTARDGQDILPGVLAERDSGMASELGVSYVNCKSAFEVLSKSAFLLVFTLQLIGHIKVAGF